MPENKPQRIGVLVVHGIGEQHQFEHLEEIVRNVAAALQADRTLTDVQIEVNFGDVAAYLADQQTLRTRSVPTAIIEVKDQPFQGVFLSFLDFDSLSNRAVET